MKLNTVKLKDILVIKYGKDHKMIPDGDYPVYGTGGWMRDCSRYLFEGESVLLPRKGTLSNFQYVAGKFWTVDTIFYTIINTEIVNPYYLYLYFKSADFSGYDSGASIPSMTTNSYYNMKFKLPEKCNQDAICSFALKYDLLIQKNNELISNLEKSIKHIYKHWFVSFKFPSSISFEMIDTKIGKIPSSFSVVRFGTLVKRNKTKLDSWANEKIIDLANMPKFSFCIKEYGNCNDFNSNIYKLNKDDLLFGSIRPYFGKACFSPIEGGVCGTVFSFKPIRDELWNFILLTISSDYFINYADKCSNGTKMPVIDYDVLCKCKIPLPNIEVIKAFNSIVTPLIKKIKELQNKNLILEEQKKMFVTRIMGGKIDIDGRGII